MTSTARCPLCWSEGTRSLLTRTAGPKYAHCGNCDLRFLLAEHRLSQADEEHRYRQHRNEVDDPAYRGFLEPLAEEIHKRVPLQSSGLDFGCGPGPALAALLAERGHKVELFDPLFYPDASSLSRTYAFVVTSEVVEHFYEPRKEFARLKGMTEPGGWLGVMTLLYRPDVDFAEWYYPRDPTHVVFYSKKTFEWIAGEYGFEKPEFSGDRMIFLRRSPIPSPQANR